MCIRDRYCRRLRIDPGTGKKNYAIVQAEDELSAIGMVVGASWNGARAFTATSGPGLSLMSEFLAVSYTHLRAHETVLDLVCRLLLENKKQQQQKKKQY